MKQTFMWVICLSLLILSGCTPAPNLKNSIMNIRQSAVAGAFYPADKAELNKLLEDFIDKDFRSNKKIQAVVVPHAGLIYSGPVAGQAFKYLNGSNFKRVMVLAPSHYIGFAGVSVGSYDAYETPLGQMPVDKNLADKLLQEEYFDFLPQAHTREHAIEIELPFLQKTLGDFKLIPLIFGSQTNLEEIKQIAQILKKYLDDETLIIASVDFTHYGPNYGFVPFKQDIEKNLAELDAPVVENFKNLKTEELYHYIETKAITNDGQIVLATLSEILKPSAGEKKPNIEMTGNNTSGKITGDSENSVHYVSFVVFGDKQLAMNNEQLTNQEKNYLLDLARKTLEYYFETGKKLEIDEREISENLKQERGVFITLNKHEQLRGCIGYILPHGKIYEAVIDNALNAAFDDPRFGPLQENELEDVEIEVSILTEPQELPISNPQDYLTRLRPEIDGVILKQGSNSATYLPQVWESLKNPGEFLESLCQKAGLNANCWLNEKTKISIYQAIVFSE